MKKVQGSQLDGKDFNTTAIDCRFSDLDYKLLKRDYKKRPQKSVQQAAINWSCHSETLAEGPGESTGWNAFNRTAIDCGVQ